MINVSFLVPILFEVMSFNDRPCLPNIGAPLKQMAFGVSLESIRRKLVLGPCAFHGNAPFKGLCCRCSFEHSFVKSGVGQFGHYLLKGLVGFVVVFLPPTFCVDGPSVGRVLCSQSVVDHIDHGASNRNVHSSFESQTSHSGKPNGVLCCKVFNWSPILVMKWFDVVVCNHNKRQICAACLPYIWFQESSFRPVFDCRPISTCTVEAILYGPVRRPKFNPQKRRPNSDRF